MRLAALIGTLIGTILGLAISLALYALPVVLVILTLKYVGVL